MTCVALFDFDAVESEDLGFKKGDLFEVIKKWESGWWFVKSLSTNKESPSTYKEGFIPSNFVMPGAHP